MTRARWRRTRSSSRRPICARLPARRSWAPVRRFRESRSTSWATRVATRRRSARTRTPAGLRRRRRRRLHRHLRRRLHLRLRPRRSARAARSRSTTLTTATPYPSTCVVSGVSGTVSDVNVNLDGMSHTFPDDVDMLLVSPDGQNAIFMSDAGGGTDIVSCNLTLDDEAATAVPDATALACPGSYKPANYEPGDPFPAPAPTPSGSVNLSTFDGGTANGTWSLYIVDDASGDLGTITSWSLNVTGGGPPRLRLRLRLRRRPRHLRRLRRLRHLRHLRRLRHQAVAAARSRSTTPARPRRTRPPASSQASPGRSATSTSPSPGSATRSRPTSTCCSSHRAGRTRSSCPMRAAATPLELRPDVRRPGAHPDPRRDADLSGDLPAGELRARRPVPGPGTDAERERQPVDLQRRRTQRHLVAVHRRRRGRRLGTITSWSLNVTGGGPPPPPLRLPAAASASAASATSATTASATSAAWL